VEREASAIYRTTPAQSLCRGLPNPSPDSRDSHAIRDRARGALASGARARGLRGARGGLPRRAGR
jgi:hypothetical protein